MSARRIAALSLALAAGAGSRASSQDSPFGIRGLGIPGRFESARARATGGAVAPLDPLSALAEASIAGVSQLTATATGGTSYLSDELGGGGTSTSRRATRFPLFQVMGPTWGRVVLAGGFTTYLDRSYRVVISDTITLGGSRHAVTDELSSDGGVTDIRLAAGRGFGPLQLGVGFHLLSGSTRMSAQRTFADTSSYGNVTQQGEVAYRGKGYSASGVLRVGRSLRLAAFWRADARLRSEENGTTVALHDLPVTVGGAVRWQPAPEAGVGASLVHRSWAGGNAGDSSTFNTTGWSVGAEVGSRRLPLRFGVRGGDLPFGPSGGSDAPREFAVAVGSGIALSEGRGIIDITVERLRRTGSGLTETAWTVLVGLVVRP